QVRCALFRNRNQNLSFQPRDGMQVEVQGLVTLYENRGEFQLIAQSLRQAGRGTLFEAFLRLKEKLEKEGLFEEERKRPLPFLPRCIGIVTSTQGAALHDVLTTLARRNPSAEIIVYPTLVQGEGAGLLVARAIENAAKRMECEVLIVCRGGGSIEDLWAFNDEAVARAIRACPMPVVSGVGHETDFTIADFAADVRAPTPTAAAELVSPERDALLGGIAALLMQLSRQFRRGIEDRAQTVDFLSRRLHHPGQRLRERKQTLTQLLQRMRQANQRSIERKLWAINALKHRLDKSVPRLSELSARAQTYTARLDFATSAALDKRDARVKGLLSNLQNLAPQRVLDRGYSVVRDAEGNIVRDAAKLSVGDSLEISFAHGGAGSRVETLRD
ncbi:MAG: exodeoxyribonuclease VII large subunit, partial [Burkholderiales bacterium]